MRMGDRWTLPKRTWILPLLTCGFKGMPETLSLSALLLQCRPEEEGLSQGKQLGLQASVLCPKHPKYPHGVAKFFLRDATLDSGHRCVCGRWLEGSCVWHLGLSQKSCQ